MSRSSWPLAVVHKTKIDADGKVRRVLLRVMGQKGVLERYVTGVVLLEANPRNQGMELAAAVDTSTTLVDGP